MATLGLVDVLAHVGRSRHRALHAASARARRWPVLVAAGPQLGLLLVPVAVDLAGVHLDADLVSPVTVAPVALGIAVVLAVAVARALRGDVVVADGGVRLRGWGAFDVADVHEVLPISWHDQSGPRRVELALLGVDGALLGRLDGRRYERDDLDAVLGAFAGRVRPPAEVHVADARRIRAAHPEAIDQRDRVLVAIQWFATIVGLLASAVASFAAIG